MMLLIMRNTWLRSKGERNCLEFVQVHLKLEEKWIGRKVDREFLRYLKLDFDSCKIKILCLRPFQRLKFGRTTTFLKLKFLYLRRNSQTYCSKSFVS